jgi:hypothetical protein
MARGVGSPLPDWPAVFVAEGRIDVSGRHGTPWRHRVLGLVALGLAMLYCLWLFVFLTNEANASLAAGEPFHPASFAWLALPLVLLIAVAVPWVRFHFVSSRLLTRALRVTFNTDGVRIVNGNAAGAKLFRYDTAEIAFRVVEHPRARRVTRRERTLDPFVESGRIEMLHGERRTVLADVAWRDRALDFVACCNWALRHVQRDEQDLFQEARHQPLMRLE